MEFQHGLLLFIFYALVLAVVAVWSYNMGSVSDAALEGNRQALTQYQVQMKDDVQHEAVNPQDKPVQLVEQ